MLEIGIVTRSGQYRGVRHFSQTRHAAKSSQRSVRPWGKGCWAVVRLCYGEIEKLFLPRVSAASITPPSNAIPRTDVPLTVGYLRNEGKSIPIRAHATKTPLLRTAYASLERPRRNVRRGSCTALQQTDLLSIVEGQPQRRKGPVPSRPFSTAEVIHVARRGPAPRDLNCACAKILARNRKYVYRLTSQGIMNRKDWVNRF